MHRSIIFMLAIAATCCLAADTSLDTITPATPVFEPGHVTHSAAQVPEVLKKVTIQSEEVTFSTDRFQLSGILVRPDSPGPHPAVVFIHGDGPVNRDGYGVYKPIWERFVEMGYACLAWDKPGVGDSTGTFTSHTMSEERARIANEAIRFLKDRSDINPDRIGIWGVSHAGYVLPLVCAANPDLAFMIAVSTPTTNRIKQSAHLIEQEIRRAGLGDAAARTYAWYFEQREKAETYEEYLNYARPLNRHAVVQDRLGLGEIVNRDVFVPYSRHKDNQLEPLNWLEKITVPVLTIFGGRDTQIAVKECIRHYRIAMRKAGNSHFRVTRLEQADHMIFDSLTGGIYEMRDNLVSGKFRMAPGYLRSMENFLGSLSRLAQN